MDDVDDMEAGEVLHTTPEPKIALRSAAARRSVGPIFGVLRALDEAGIQVSMVAGTSIGTLVGGCYLAGKLDQLGEFARSLTMRRIIALLDLAIGGSGPFGDMRLSKRMREHLANIEIEDLNRPFTAIATEITTGHEIWIHSGSLATAIHASYALPGIFEPVLCNGRTLVDGALVNPVPVSVCRAQEERPVVAVNLHYDLYGRSAVVRHAASEKAGDEQDLTSAIDKRKSTRIGMTNVMVESFNIIQDRVSRTRLAGNPPDLLMMPRLSDIGLSEFHRASEVIDCGYEEARMKIEYIQRLQEVLLSVSASKVFQLWQCLASPRMRMRIWAMMVHALEPGTDFSRSLAGPRHRPSHAKIRSTTHRRGNTLKPFWSSQRLITSIVHPPLAPRRVIEFVTGITIVSGYMAQERVEAAY